MIDPFAFFRSLQERGVGFFTGVPDSLLKSFCACISDQCNDQQHIIAANEGNAVALAAGYHLVYLQNSGLGNALNPLLSLADKEVYSIPMVLLIGWRGEPGIKDEPQHIKQGRIQPALLQAMECPVYHLKENTPDPHGLAEKVCAEALATSGPVALVVHKGTFASYVATQKTPADQEDPAHYPSREEALCEVVKLLPENALVVATTGKLSRELFEYRTATGEGHANDFLTVGSMGHCAQIALGIALNTSRQVFCLDGDGAALMHMGGMAVTAQNAPENFCHILFNNGSHESVGGQPTPGHQIHFPSVAKALGYNQSLMLDSAQSIREILPDLISKHGPLFVELKVSKGSRSDLGRPTTTPVENKMAMMNLLLNRNE